MDEEQIHENPDRRLLPIHHGAQVADIPLPGLSGLHGEEYRRRRPHPVGVVVMLALLLPGPRWTRGFLLAAGVYALVQIWLSDQQRYLLPALPLAVLAVAWWLDRLAARVD